MYRLITVAVVMTVLATACNNQKKEESTTALTSLEAPKFDELVIYEVFVRNFTPEGSFQAIIPQLDRLKNLGVNTLWLMPIHPVGEKNRKGTYGSPYSIRDFYDVNPEFGTKDDFKALVEACHAKGLYVIIDLVANHTAWDNQWIEDHPDWYTTNDSGEIVPPVEDWMDVADLNYDNPAVPAEMAKVMEYWVKEFNIDGYRCDVAYMVPDDFWQNAISRIRDIKPIIMLAEAAGEKFHTNGFNYTYGWETYHQLKKVFAGEPAASLMERVEKEMTMVPADGQMMRFITNHDETSWDDVPVNLFQSREGSMAAFAISSTLPGIPLVYNGQEVGHPEKMNLFEKSHISWNANPQMQAEYAEIIALVRQEKALRGSEISFYTDEDIVAYKRGTGEDALYILVNCRKDVVGFEAPAELVGRSFINLATGKSIKIGENINILGYNYYILKGAIES